MSSVSGLSGGCSVSLSELLELFLLFVYGRRREGEEKTVRKEERVTMIKGSGLMKERRRGREKWTRQ